MSTPGLLYVESVITEPSHLSSETFTQWYEQEHIPDILATSGINVAFRYESVDPHATRPYLACYPLQSLEFLQTPEFTSIPIHSTRFLPPGPDGGAGRFFDHADFDMRYYQLLADTGKAMSTTVPWLISVCSTEPLGKFEHSAMVRRRDYRLKGRTLFPSEQKHLADPLEYLSIFVFREEPQGVEFSAQSEDQLVVKRFKSLSTFHAE